MPHFRYLTECSGAGCDCVADAAWREVRPSAIAWKKSANGDTYSSDELAAELRLRWIGELVSVFVSAVAAAGRDARHLEEMPAVVRLLLMLVRADRPMPRTIAERKTDLLAMVSTVLLQWPGSRDRGGEPSEVQADGLDLLLSD